MRSWRYVTTLHALGVEPIMASAGAERLRRLAELGLRERLGGERPPDGRATLDAADSAAGWMVDATFVQAVGSANWRGGRPQSQLSQIPAL